jgi:hypothetical protein
MKRNEEKDTKFCALVFIAEVQGSNGKNTTNTRAHQHSLDKYSTNTRQTNQSNGKHCKQKQQREGKGRNEGSEKPHRGRSPSHPLLFECLFEEETKVDSAEMQQETKDKEKERRTSARSRKERVVEDWDWDWDWACGPTRLLKTPTIDFHFGLSTGRNKQKMPRRKEKGDEEVRVLCLR